MIRIRGVLRNRIFIIDPSFGKLSLTCPVHNVQSLLRSYMLSVVHVVRYEERSISSYPHIDLSVLGIRSITSLLIDISAICLSFSHFNQNQNIGWNFLTTNHLRWRYFENELRTRKTYLILVYHSLFGWCWISRESVLFFVKELIFQRINSIII